MDSKQIDIDGILNTYGGYDTNSLANIFDPDTNDHEPILLENSPYHWQ